MRKSLHELIGAGEYELAAHRLVYGAVKARLGADARSGRRGASSARRTGTAGAREQREDPDRGHSTK
ncbi:MAG: hypothetical protein M0R22_09070 [Dehalococcoidia bacterium]|nr:hypothetical protein [Dehalococcoidia bacterium]